MTVRWGYQPEEWGWMMLSGLKSRIESEVGKELEKEGEDKSRGLSQWRLRAHWESSSESDMMEGDSPVSLSWGGQEEGNSQVEGLGAE
ncbi:hypothetical protein NDU88_003050 [Pleurodeles waltl]|uniref:Uncharacterized protein n=1 Tax=Pleurodeles waltl TaxID=8319 RepID=A0AAV7LE58_PLEWA|nr:hypothetical protein NDU88_003050 [Pleurodeles waltl]